MSDVCSQGGRNRPLGRAGASAPQEPRRRAAAASRSCELAQVRPDAVLSLLDRWRADAAVLRRRGAPTVADALEACAAELEAAVDAWLVEELSIREAAAESGYSEDHLRELVRTDQLAGRNANGRVRVRRSDLPRRPRAPRPSADQEVVADLAAELTR